MREERNGREDPEDKNERAEAEDEEGRMRSSLCFLAALLLSSPSHIEGFVPPRSTPQLQHATSSRHEHADNNSGRQSSETIFYNDFDEPQISEDLDVSSLLQKRAKELRRAERQLLKNWRSGKTKSYGAITINERYLIDKDQDPDLPFDWVRRVDIGKWPRIACGSAHGEKHGDMLPRSVSILCQFCSLYS